MMELRVAVAEDALEVARVHVRSWQEAYRGLLPQAYLDGLRAEDRAAVYDFAHVDATKPRTVVAVEYGRVLGFATTMPARDAGLAGCGELCALYVDPDAWGRGVGVALVSAAREWMAEIGYREAMLWLLAGNARGERFYRADGWRADGERRTDTVWGAVVDEVRYRRML